MNRSTEIIIGIVILAAIIILISIFTVNPKNQNASTNRLATDSGSVQAKTPSEPQTEPAIVTYTDNGFSPLNLTIASGTTVVFKNQSSSPMWPASAFHPTHRAYPGSGIEKCGTPEQPKIFDACGEIPAGQSWSFKFDIPGTWKYHDHLNPEKTGIITVEPLK